MNIILCSRKHLPIIQSTFGNDTFRWWTSIYFGSGIGNRIFSGCNRWSCSRRSCGTSRWWPYSYFCSSSGSRSRYYGKKLRKMCRFHGWIILDSFFHFKKSSINFSFNWSKTFIMFVHNKRIITPTFLDCEGIHLTAVTKFKLLGFIIDQKFDFQSHVAHLCLTINR